MTARIESVDTVPDLPSAAPPGIGRDDAEMFRAASARVAPSGCNSATERRTIAETGCEGLVAEPRHFGAIEG
jgi:hypothetical protein